MKAEHKTLAWSMCAQCGREYTQRQLVKCPTDGAYLTILADQLVNCVIEEKYNVLELVGSGGWSRVYKAKHLALSRLVAIKVLNRDLLNQSEALTRFRHEAKLSSRLDHENIARVLDFGVIPSGQPFIVMEYLDGRSLDRVLDAQGPIEPARALRIAGKIARALEFAHREGIVHRDLKPGNVIMLSDGVSGDDQVKVVDFGLAKLMEPNATLATLTADGQTVGTPGYMSPEQCRGESVDARTDLYAVGCILYEMLQGRPFVSGTVALDCMYQHMTKQPDLVVINDDTFDSEQIQILINSMLAKDSANRLRTASELIAALDAVLSGLPVNIGNTALKTTNRLPLLLQYLIGAVGVIFCVGILAAALISPKHGGSGHPVAKQNASSAAKVAVSSSASSAAGSVVNFRTNSTVNISASSVANSAAANGDSNKRYQADEISFAVPSKWKVDFPNNSRLFFRARSADERFRLELKKYAGQSLDSVAEFAEDSHKNPEYRLLKSHAGGKIGQFTVAETEFAPSNDDRGSNYKHYFYIDARSATGFFYKLRLVARYADAADTTIIGHSFIKSIKPIRGNVQ